MNSQNEHNRLDEATSQRLAGLASMPVDTSRLDKLIESQIPRPRSGIAALFQPRPVRAIAASLAMFGIIGVIVWSLSGGAVFASLDTMAQLHEDLVSGKIAAMKIDTIDDANKALSHIVEIPQVPVEHVMMCCMQSVKNKRVACVVLQSEGVPVTMAVASTMDISCPDNSQMMEFGGNHYHVQQSGKLNMVMTEREGRWICLIGALPADRLISIAAAIRL
jgi:hypothetical protein